MPTTEPLGLCNFQAQPMYPQGFFVHGRVGYAYVIRQYGTQRRWYKYYYPYDPKTVYQRTQRGYLSQAVKNWQEFSEDTKEFYRQMAYPDWMSGYNRYIYFYMRKNRLQL